MRGSGPGRIVVGLAGHAGTVHTLAWAIAESAATGAQLVVVHGGWPGAGRGLGARGSLGALETVDRSAAGAVAAARARLGERAVRILVCADAPGDALVNSAGPGDVLVIGGPSRTGWWVRSGTTNHVMTRARCPVIVVPEPSGAAGPPARARVGQGVATPSAGAPVVVGASGSPAALAYGLAYADGHGLPLVVTRGRPDQAARQPASLIVIGAGGSALHPLGVTCRSLVAGADCPVAVVH